MSSKVENITGRVIVAAQIVAKPGKEDEVARRLSGIRDVARSDKEPGTHTYRIARYEGTFTVFEEYEDGDAFAVHAGGPISALAAEKDELLKEISWNFFKEY